MYYNTTQTNHSDNSYKIGSFLVTEVQRTRFTAALNVARQMRVPGDDDVDDAVRAIVLLQGGAYFDDEWHGMEAEDEADYDRQATAYYDGAAELLSFLDGDEDMTYLRVIAAND
jgi:hypothetical protein